MTLLVLVNEYHALLVHHCSSASMQPSSALSTSTVPLSMSSVLYHELAKGSPEIPNLVAFAELIITA